MKLKIHEAYRKIVALADSDLIGKTFEEGIKQIEVRPNFFNGEEIEKEVAVKVLQDMEREDATFCIVGEKSTETALKAGIISKQGIIKIQNIPVALGLF
jgi:hypothetical protein